MEKKIQVTYWLYAAELKIHNSKSRQSPSGLSLTVLNAAGKPFRFSFRVPKQVI